jgi:hypothetical protein
MFIRTIRMADPRGHDGLRDATQRPGHESAPLKEQHAKLPKPDVAYCIVYDSLALKNSCNHCHGGLRGCRTSADALLISVSETLVASECAVPGRPFALSLERAIPMARRRPSRNIVSPSARQVAPIAEPALPRDLVILADSSEDQLRYCSWTGIQLYKHIDLRLASCGPSHL